MGKALYRKYRSKSLSEIIGQSHITNVLESSIKSGKISHAYLFTGPRGTGKTSVARIFAHLINDFPYEIEDSYLDIIEIDAASNTGVDNIRDLREKAIIAPSRGKYKIYIIDEVHMLSKSAFNALLKTLEEPPAHVIFIMATTDAHKVPITITSRSQQFAFRLADLDTMTKHLKQIATAENINITDEALEIIAKRGGGSFRDSISLLDQISTFSDQQITADTINSALGLPSDSLIEAILTSHASGDTATIIDTLKNLDQLGLKPEITAEELIRSIIRNPLPHHLPLLSALLSVPRSPHPQAHLLLALLPSEEASDAHETKSGDPRRAILGDDRKEVSNAGVRKTGDPREAVLGGGRRGSTAGDLSTAGEEADRTQNTSSDEPVFHQQSQATSQVLAENQFNWQTFLDSIKQSSTPLHSHLIKLSYEISEKTLTIYTKSKLIKTILEKPQNKSLISNLISPLSFELIPSTPTTENTPPPTPPPPPDNSSLKAISDIMGGEVQEVQINGDIA